MSGRVVHGDGRGRLLGFPTANLACGGWPGVGDGVYAVRVGIDDEPPSRPGLASLGSSPTFDIRERRLEVHLIDYAGDLYGRRLQVAFCARLTGQRRCTSPAQLAARIHALVTIARRGAADGDSP